METSFATLARSTNKTRRYDLDWLRVIAFSLLILYHTGMFFVPWGWHVKNNEISETIKWPMLFLSQWRMPLLFFISGAGVYFALGKRSAGQFAGERFKRIFLPLVFGMFVIVPPQIYYERLTQGATFNYWEFYPSVFDFVPYPEGSFSWHHLWYLPYILVYSLIGLPLFLYIRREKGQQVIHSLTKYLSTRGGIFLVIVPAFFIEWLLRPHWPTTHNLIADWANFSISFFVFLVGFIICSNERLHQAMEINRKMAFIGGIVAFSALYIFYWSDWPENISTWQMALFRLLATANGWCWIVTIVGFGRKYLNRNSFALQYANEAVYPFYILHQTITVAVAYYLIDSLMPIALKFLLISGATFLGAWVLYEYIIRRFTITRLLFGLKPLPKSMPTHAVIATPERVV